jgi:ketosteroid isomerase-like protein
MAEITTQRTRELVRAYHDAWTAGDIATAGRYLTEDFSTRAPVGSYDTKDAYLAGLTRFRGLVTGLELISELYGEGEATLLYDVHTSTPAGTLRTAEHFRVGPEGIVSTQLIFDATDWKAMLAEQGATVDADGYVTRPRSP